MNSMAHEIQHIRGQYLDAHPGGEWVSRPSGHYVRIPGSHGDGDVYLTEDMMSKHFLAMGSIGSGKSTLLYHVVHGILQWEASAADRIIFFDPKGDYLRIFGRRLGTDAVCIGHTGQVHGDAWNLIADIMDDPEGEPDMELLRLIATTLFKKQIDSSNNPTFPTGARDLFVGLTKVFIARCRREGRASFAEMNNASLKSFFDRCVTDGEAISRILEETPDQAWLKTYLIAPKSATTQSYLAPLQTMMNEVFTGCFARAGEFSIRRFMRGGTGKRALFLEYDPETGCINDTVYTALIDLAMKESIGRRSSGRNCFFILDEFPMIPALTYIGQVLQYARSLNVKLVAALQNTYQLKQKYGEAEAMNILSGFSTVIAFRLFDEASRAIVSERHGERLVRIRCPSAGYNAPPQELIQELDVIADWDITSLEPGQCVFSPWKGRPFFFYPAMYRENSSFPAPASQHRLTVLSEE